ncbi:MAG TPA: biliverdin-producing heme oxygenase [Kofleriaceae bacterium]
MVNAKALAVKPPSWMLLRLGLETHQHHATADADRIALMEVASPADYRAQLARIHGFEAAVEQALLAVLDARIVRERTKSHWLRRDLHALGLTTEDVDCVPHFTVRLTSVTQALGWLFVLERHTLLAGLIHRQLEHRFGAEVVDATSYLCAYGDSPGARFRSLCEVLDQHGAQHATHPTLIVAGASEAFRAQCHWYRTAADDRQPRLEPVGFTADRSSLTS